MSEWKEYRLGDISKFSYGKMPKKELLGKGSYPTFSGYKYQFIYPEKNIEKGDVIVVARGVGGTGDVKLVKEDAYLTNLSIKFDLENSIIDNKYLYYSFKKNNLRHLDSGSAQSQITIGDLNNVIINLPPLPEQKAIAHILSNLDEKIELNRKMNQTLEAMAQGLFKSWFVDFDPVIDNALAQGNPIPEELQTRGEKRKGLPDSKKLLSTNPSLAAQFPAAFVFNETLGKWIPEGWEVKKLQELVDVKYGKDHKKLGDGTIPCYGSGGIMRYVEKPLFTKESVLIPRKGSLDNVMYVNTPFWSVDTMFYTEMKEGHFVKYFFYTVNKLKFSEMNEGSAVPSMTTAQLNSMDILLPSINCLSLFDKTVSKYFKKKEGNEAEMETLTQLRDRLLPELISGRVSSVNNKKLK